MKLDTTIATLSPAKFFAGQDQNGKFFVVKKSPKGNTKPVMPCKSGNMAVMAANTLSALENMSVAITLQVIAKARSI